jgi:transposase
LHFYIALRYTGFVSKRFRTCDLEQVFLLPPSLQDWLPENHLARFIAEVMNELDLSAIYAKHKRADGRGLAAYHPLMMARLLLYAYCLGVTSSRKIERATREDVAFRYLAANQQPDHDTIASYRQNNLQELAGIFIQVLRLCEQAGLVKLGNIAIDGTKMLANASTGRSVPYAKLAEREKYWLEAVERLLREAREKDQEEDARYGKGQKESSLPAELAKAQSRLQRIQQAKAELEQEAQAQLKVASEKHVVRKRGRPRKDDPPTAFASKQEQVKERNRYKRAQKNAAHPTRQYNFVDPDSRVMVDNRHKCFVQSYNAQVAVDSQAQVIVAAEITQQTNDCQQLIPRVNSVQAVTAAAPKTALADAGYFDTESLKDPSLEGIQVLVSPDAKPQSPATSSPPSKPYSAQALQMREALATEAGKALYALRKTTVEPVFGQIKEGRNIRRFRFRGLKQVAAEWKLVCATHNLLKLFRQRVGLLAASSLPAVAGTAMA